MTPKLFSSKLKLDEKTGCLNWTGAMRGRYGTVILDGKGQCAHRYAAYLAGMIATVHGENGNLGSDLVLHRCDNPLCCNPDHFFIGDHAANQADKVQKKRQARGTVQWRASLTEREVLTARVAAAEYGVEYRTIAKFLNKNEDTVGLACKGVSWEWLVGDADPALLVELIAAQATKKKHEPVKGAQHGRSKLSQSQVDEMRKLRAVDKLGVGELAEMYGLGREQTSKILNFRSWT